MGSSRAKKPSRRSITCPKMAENEDLKNMVLSFRVSELQMLLGFAGRNKTGRKTELQSRALDLLKLRSSPVTMKIKELYKTIQHGMVSLHSLSSSSFSREMTMQQQQQAASQHSQQVVQTMTHNAHHPMAHHSTAHHHPQQQQQQPHLSRISYHTQPYGSQQMDRNMQSRGSVYGPGLYQYPQKPAIAPAVQFPIHPDVRFKKLPFYDHIAELLKPSTLLPQGPGRYQESSFVFHLTPQQATDIASCRDLLPGSKVDYVIQVQMRFCLLETSCEQDDCFPSGICLKVNGKICPLPNPIPTTKAGVEPKRPSRPVNITPLVKLCPAMANQAAVSWAPEFNRNYATCIYLVRKLTSSDLLQRLKARGLRHADYTRGLIKEKLNEEADNEIAATSLKASLICPLGKMRMTTPCRPSTCYHLQCFDASLFLQMNEKKPMWICPFCDKQALYDNLVLDGYFHEVLQSKNLPPDCNDIQLHSDGSWSATVVKKDPSLVVPCTTAKTEPQIETVSDESETPVVLPKEAKKQPIVVDLTLSDSDEGEDDSDKMVVSNIPDSSIQDLSSVHSIPLLGNPLNSSSSNNSRTHSERRGVGSSQGPGSHNSGRGGVNHSGGPASVSSSGYMSPNIITLDSPSPPATPNSHVAPILSLPVSAFPTSSPVPYSSLPPLPSTSPCSSSSSSSSSSSPASYPSLRPRRVRNFNRNVILSSSSSSSSPASESASPQPSPPLEALGPYPSCPTSQAPSVPQTQPISQLPQDQQQQQLSQYQIPSTLSTSQSQITPQSLPQSTLSQQTLPLHSVYSPETSAAQCLGISGRTSTTARSAASSVLQSQSITLPQTITMQIQNQQQQRLNSPSPPLDLYATDLPSFLDLDSDSNGSHSGAANNLFHRF